MLPTLTLTVSPTSVPAGGTFTVIYTAADPDEGRETTGTSVNDEGQPFDWHRTYHDTLTLVPPTAPGVTFTPTVTGVWTGKAPASAGTVTVTGSVTDVTNNTTTATATLTVTAAPVATKCKIGMSTPASLWNARRAQVEATGGKLQARRIFMSGFTDSLSIVQDAIDEGLYPVISTKSGSWSAVANGNSDTQFKALVNNLKNMCGTIGCALAVHHEPGQQALGPTKGENGTAAEFAAMYTHLEPLAHAASNIDFGPIMNGWMWTNAAASFSDAELEVWMPKTLRAKFDFVGADDYSPAGGEPGVVKTRNRAAWAKRVGSVKALGVGETNAFVAKDLQDSFAYCKSEPLFQGGWALVWNSTGDAYVPLQESGLLDEFQAILKNW